MIFILSVSPDINSHQNRAEEKRIKRFWKLRQNILTKLYFSFYLFELSRPKKASKNKHTNKKRAPAREQTFSFLLGSIRGFVSTLTNLQKKKKIFLKFPNSTLLKNVIIKVFPPFVTISLPLFLCVCSICPHEPAAVQHLSLQDLWEVMSAAAPAAPGPVGRRGNH